MYLRIDRLQVELPVAERLAARLDVRQIHRARRPFGVRATVRARASVGWEARPTRSRRSNRTISQALA